MVPTAKLDGTPAFRSSDGVNIFEIPRPAQKILCLAVSKVENATGRWPRRVDRPIDVRFLLGIMPVPSPDFFLLLASVRYTVCPCFVAKYIPVELAFWFHSAAPCIRDLKTLLTNNRYARVYLTLLSVQKSRLNARSRRPTAYAMLELQSLLRKHSAQAYDPRYSTQRDASLPHLLSPLPQSRPSDQ